jgi:hypothetical protein
VRIRGGTRGLLSGIDAGRLDPFDAYVYEEPHLHYLTSGKLAKMKREQRAREKRRAKRLASLPPF